MNGLICDASPLILLAKAEILGILPKLFSPVLAPRSVHSEILRGPRDDPMKLALASTEWLRFVTLDPPLSPLGSFSLGPGESEAIELARRQPGATLLVDDRAARRTALAFGIPVIGTLSAVAMAVRQQHISSFEQMVDRLRKAGMYVSQAIVEEVERALKEV